MDDPFDLIGDVLDGQFRVEAFAGEGDLSVVYKGHHIGVDAPVAIKCLNLPDTLDPALARPLVHGFTEASRIHYRLARGNLHIAQTIASGSTLAPRTGVLVPYLVREWFDGESLASDLARRRAAPAGSTPAGGRSLDEALALLETAFDGVAYAHEQGDVHLSVNPSNLFVVARAGAASSATRSLKVLDFGVARTMNGIAPGLGQGPGARPGAGLRLLFPAYAAPEQLDRTVGELGPWTDVYALALVTMEVLSGRLVMNEIDTGALVERALDDKRRPSPQAHGLKLPAQVERALSRALSRAPDRRQKNAGELWRELKSAGRSLSPSLPPAAGPSLSPAARPSLSPVRPSLSPARPSLSPVRPSLSPARLSLSPPARPSTGPLAMGPLSSIATPAPAPVAMVAPPPRARTATLVGLSPVGASAPHAGVAGALGNRAHVPSAPSVETSPMAFAPASQNEMAVAPVALSGVPVATPWPIIPAPALSGARLSQPAAAHSPLPSPTPFAAPPSPDPVASAPPPVPAFSHPPAPFALSPSAPPVALRMPVAPFMPSNPPSFAPPGASFVPRPSIPTPPPPLMPAGRTTSMILVGAGSLGWISILALTMFPMLSWCRAREPAHLAADAPSVASASETPAATLAPGAPETALAPGAPAPPAATAPSAFVAPEPAVASGTALTSVASVTRAPLAPFSMHAAKVALDQTARDVLHCRRGKTFGTAFATVTFGADGAVSRVSVGTPFTGTAAAECVAEVLSTGRVAPFVDRPDRPGVIVYRFYVAPR